MNNINKYTSPFLSKKIHDLAKKKGIELESEMWWAENSYLTEYYKIEGKKKVLKAGEMIPLEVYPAYDTAELGEMLKNYGYKKLLDNEYYITDVFYEADYWQATIKWSYTSSQDYIVDNCETEIEARGQMYFYLLDNNLL